MKKSDGYLRLSLAAGFMALLPMSAHANLISNGTFASTCLSGSFCTYFGGDSTNIPGWTVSPDSVDLITGYWQAPPTGGNSVDLDGNNPGDVSTSFATTLGKKYKVSFELSGNPDGGAGLKSLLVTAGGGSAVYGFTTGANTHANMLWTGETLTFTATGGLTTLDFQSLDSSGPFGPVIGNVDVAAVPEPASLALFGAGLAGLGAMRRRKARKST